MCLDAKEIGKAKKKKTERGNSQTFREGQERKEMEKKSEEWQTELETRTDVFVLHFSFCVFFLSENRSRA